MPQGEISRNITAVIKTAEETAKNSPYKPATDVMSVIKYASDEEALTLIRDGRITILGESRVQDAAGRWLGNPGFIALRNKISLHFIGHLQTNKTGQALEIFDSIDSLDSLKLALEINRKAEKNAKKVPVMIQLKLSDSETQYGVRPEDLKPFMKELSALPWLSPRGLMVIAPNTGDEKLLNAAFSGAKNVYDVFFSSPADADGHKNYFSAGMSGDFETAIKNGSNLVRLGSLFFRTHGGKARP